MEQIVTYVFELCVDILWWLGNFTGLGYKGINVLIFCVIWPLFTIWLIWMVIKQKGEIKRLKVEKR